ncbi:MogA/MoaB family molybdenum cofactor biosynthesis protein [Ruania albidiflava]|uniref:MogA/MoaB family molybdenum cofactor biosynthesis protein n=1 Tax=Ruania albidiflava TaxID=366586 RepID=UPI0003B634BD|nr:MogA/MoaB family molybdenum cofactor biosynthesis protein [Ruania albidiflava]
MADQVRATVITVSDRCANGVREDRSGPEAARRLTEAGYAVEVQVVPDGADNVADAITAAVGSGAQLVLTSGGTGVGPRDLTPEGTSRVLEKVLPGVAEAIRRRDEATVPTSALGRGVAGTCGSAFVVNAPGSVGGVVAAVEVVLPLVAHVLSQLDGGDH